MSCRCGDPSCNCLESCCCPSKFCVCIACFNLRKSLVAKNEENKPFELVSNSSSDSQKFDVSNTDCHLKDEGLIHISSSSSDEIENDVVFIGSHDINREAKTCSLPRVSFPEIVLSDNEYEVVSIEEKKDNILKITSENRNRSRNFKGKSFCNFSNKGTNLKYNRRKSSCWNRKSDQNSYQRFKKKANISKFQHGLQASLEHHQDIAIPDNVDRQVTENNVIENSNFNRYFSEASSSRSNAQENETIQELPVSNIRNNPFKSETDRCINENNVTENSNLNRYFSKTSPSCSTYKSPVPNVRNNSLRSETNRCINENSVTENSNFKRYFSEGSSSRNAIELDQENDITQVTPVSNIINIFLRSETNRCMNENNVTENSNFNRYFSEASSSCNSYKSEEKEIMLESSVSNIKNNLLKSETNRCINKKNVNENSKFNRYFSEGSSSWNAIELDQENEITQETPVSKIRNNSLRSEAKQCINENNVTENSSFNKHFSERSWSWNAIEFDQKNEITQEIPVSNIRNNTLRSETNRCVNENNVTENSNLNRYVSKASSSCSPCKSEEKEIMQESSVSNIINNPLKSETNRCVNEKNVNENSNFNRYFSEGSSSWNAIDLDQENEITQEVLGPNIRNDSLELETNRYGIFTHKPNFNGEKQKSSWNNCISAPSGKKTFSEITVLQPDEKSSSFFGPPIDLTSAVATLMQTNKDSAAKSPTFNRNRRKNFPDVRVYNFDEKNIARNLSDQGSLTRLKSHKRYVQSHNSGRLTINIQPDVSHRGCSGNNSLDNTNEAESSCKTSAKKNKHVAFVLPSFHSSSKMCNGYQQTYRNSFPEKNDGKLDYYKAMKNSKRDSCMNPSHSLSKTCNDCQANYAFRKEIIKRWLKDIKRRCKKKRTCPINKFTGKLYPPENYSSKGGSVEEIFHAKLNKLLLETK